MPAMPAFSGWTVVMPSGQYMTPGGGESTLADEALLLVRYSDARKICDGLPRATVHAFYGDHGAPRAQAEIADLRDRITLLRRAAEAVKQRDFAWEVSEVQRTYTYRSM